VKTANRTTPQRNGKGPTGEGVGAPGISTVSGFKHKGERKEGEEKAERQTTKKGEEERDILNERNIPSGRGQLFSTAQI